MEQEATDELLGRNRHDMRPLWMAVVFPLKRNLTLSQRVQALIANGNAMGVTAKVFQNLLRSAERRLGVNHPVFAAQPIEVGAKGRRLPQGRLLAEELELTARKELFEGIEDAAAKQGREYANGQEKTGTAGDPSIVIRAEAAAGNDIVDVGMETSALTIP